jgi:hypothetical protein
MGLFDRVLHRALDLAMGEAQPLNTGYAAEPPDAGALKRALDELAAGAFDFERGRVDYPRLAHEPGYAAYRAKTAGLKAFDLSRLDSREERLAFWLNIYNALVIDGVVALGIKESVREVPRLGFFRRVAYDIGGEIFSLEDIEHGILRSNRRHPAYPMPQFSGSDRRARHVIWPLEPRVHFALTCASRSCPPIAFYDAAKIDQQLDLAAKNFLGGGGCEVDGGQATLSSIFKWYAADFGGGDGVLAFVAKNHPDEKARALFADPSRPPRIEYAPYDWRLNK